jgi:hypothetical protein
MLALLAPAIAFAGATIAIFEFVERISSKGAKASVTKQITMLDPGMADRLPHGANQLFKTIFGSYHFSRTCFLRSASISFAGMLFFLAIAYVTYVSSEGGYFWWDIFALSIHNMGEHAVLLLPGSDYIWMTAIWVPFSIFLDYIILYKTRLVIGILSVRQYTIATIIAVGLLDIIIGYYIFFIILGSFQNLVEFAELPDESWYLPFYTYDAPFILWPINSVSALFYASALPSLWLWLFIASIIFARVITHSQGALGWLRWFLDIESAPFRSVGVVAAGLSFALISIPLVLMTLLRPAGPPDAD